MQSLAFSHNQFTYIFIGILRDSMNVSKRQLRDGIKTKQKVKNWKILIAPSTRVTSVEALRDFRAALPRHTSVDFTRTRAWFTDEIHLWENSAELGIPFYGFLCEKFIDTQCLWHPCHTSIIPGIESWAMIAIEGWISEENWIDSW